MLTVTGQCPLCHAPIYGPDRPEYASYNSTPIQSFPTCPCRERLLPIAEQLAWAVVGMVSDMREAVKRVYPAPPAEEKAP